MAGGNWSVQNKVRPGAYIQFKARRNTAGGAGERGVVAFTAPLPWGNPSTVIEIDTETFYETSLEKLGFKAGDARIRHIAAAASHVNKLLLYRLGGSGAEKAKVTEGNVTATAKWGGTRGNDLQIAAQVNIDDQTRYDVSVLLDGEQVDVQTVVVAEELKSNSFVEFSGTGELAAIAGASLTGGSDGTASGTDFTAALEAFASYDFDVLGVPLEDETSKQLTAAYVKRMRENEGKKLVATVVNYPQANSEGVISLRNSIITSDGLVVPAEFLLWEVAAMQAGAAVNQSLTYAEIPNGVDAHPRLTNAQTIEALKNGELVITALNGKAIIEQDINTLTSFDEDKSKAFGKNRVIRTLDAVHNDVKRIFDRFYIGKVSNNADGRALLEAEVVKYLQSLEAIGAIEDFDSKGDISILPGTDKDAVVVNLSIKPTDSIEKIYMTVEVL